MADQQQKARTSTREEAQVEAVEIVENSDELLGSIDAMLDEIESVLEENDQAMDDVENQCTTCPCGFPIENCWRYRG